MKNKDTPNTDIATKEDKKLAAKKRKNENDRLRREEEKKKGEELDRIYKGRQLKFETEEELEAKIQEYKDYLIREKKPPTIAGLAYFLDIDRQTLYNYGRKERYFCIIKKAVEWVVLQMEEKCADKAHAGIIFLMKNYGYTDRETNNVTVNVSLETQLKDMQGDEF